MMLNNLTDLLRNALYWIPALIIALSFHEYAHGKAADLLGDPTPRYHGRLTLNPLKHVDPVGLLMLLLVKFGWAKPVPVNPMYFKGNRRRGMLLVALAGPGMNFAVAVLAGLGLAVSYFLLFRGFNMAIHAYYFFEALLSYNVFLGLFNLLPVPPLDGSKILFNLLPPRYSYYLHQLEQYGFLILILMLATGVHRYFLLPAAYAVIGYIINFSALLISPFLGG